MNFLSSTLHTFAQLMIERPDAVPDNPLSPDTIQGLLNLAFGVLGGIALIILVLQGMRYAYSGGDPGKTAQARNGIIYAFLGIVVATTGASITNFVLTTVVPTTGGEGDLLGDNSIFVNVAGLLAMVTGVVSVVMVIIGGYRMTLSQGDPSKFAAARNSVLYALVGVAVAAIALPLLMFGVGLLTE